MSDSSNSRLFNIDLKLLSEALANLAEDIDFFISDDNDNLSDYDSWERRVNAGRHLVRIRAILNNGELDLAAVDSSTLETLRTIWQAITWLEYGRHHEDSASYRGPLFLPGEVKSDGSVASADEEYCPWSELFSERRFSKFL